MTNLATLSEFEFREIFINLKNKGKLVSPRGQKSLEVEGFTYVLSPYVRFQSFECRNFKLNYVKDEVLWYLRANKLDQSILDHASMWKGLVNQDGTINSNYGQYIFGPLTSEGGGYLRDQLDTTYNSYKTQFDNVVETLLADKDSRRASITILQPKHLLSTTKDVPCTYSMNFRIRDNKLNMSVHMRSQDAIFGMGNDAPAFSIIQEMVYATLKDVYLDLDMGTYTHTADSFHIYERHFEMLDKIIAGDKYREVRCPMITGIDEVRHLRGTIHLEYPEGKSSINYHNIAAATKALRSIQGIMPANMTDILAGNSKTFEFSSWLLNRDAPPTTEPKE